MTAPARASDPAPPSSRDGAPASARAAALVMHELADSAAMVEAAAAFVTDRLSDAIACRSRAVFAVSGGRSPRALLERLARSPLDWARVVVVLVDERAVGLRHPLSNTSAVRDWLIRDCARFADLRGFVPDSPDARLEPGELAKRATAAYPDRDRIDVALLGLGLDGHIASIFAGMVGYDEMVDPANPAIYAPVRLDQPPIEAPVDRVSLTLARLIDARCLILPLAGPDKRAAFEKGARAPDRSWPVSLLLERRHAPLHVWLTRS